MELAIAAGVLGLGYALQNNSKTNTKDEEVIDNNEIPSVNNVYKSNYSKHADSQEMKKVEKNFNASKKPIESNVIPKHFNQKILNKKNEPQLNDSNDITGHKSQLTGTVIENFTHNNMVPFFGDSAKQNVYEYANQSILENHTGNLNYNVSKKEIEPLFKPTRNVSNVNGASIYKDSLLERYLPSINRRNEVPIEPVRVGPGINRGYTAKPTGGFQQQDIRDVVMPKTVDELRVLSKPKLTYKGKIVPGKSKINKRRTIGKMYKHRPETTQEHGPEKWFTTTGAQIKAKQRPEILLQDTQRMTTSTNEIGIAAPTNGENITQRPKIRRSRNNTYEGSGPRNANANGQWVNEEVADYGKGNIEMFANSRDITGLRTHISNLSAVIKEITLPLQDLMKTTKKENMIHSNNVGNFGTQGPSKITVWDPEDVARTTVRNTLDAVDTTINLKEAAPNRLTVYDPTDVARTTLKEMNIDDNHLGCVSISHIDKNNGYIIESSIMNAPTTNKQLTSDHSYIGVADSANDKPMSHEAWENMTQNYTKEGTLVGRKPTDSNVSVPIGKKNINVKIKKIENNYLNKRKGLKTQFGKAIPSLDNCGMTNTRQKINYEQISNRIDPSFLDAHRSNPYTQPLDSVA